MQLNNQFKILIIMASVLLTFGCSTHRIPGFINRTATAIVAQIYDQQEGTQVDVICFPEHSGEEAETYKGLAVPAVIQPIQIGDRVAIEILYHINQSGSKEPSRGEPFTVRIISKK